MNHLRMVIGLGVLLTGGCELADIGTEVKYVGPFQTARPFDCRMQMTFGPLPYPHQDIARAKTDCPDHMDNEELCLDSMRRKACLAGADIVYGIAQTREGGVDYLNATFARSLPGPIEDAVSSRPAELACDPICSPGFVCERGTCLPQCNPKCAADEICTRQRLCAPTKPTKRMSSDSQAEARRQIATVISWDQGRARRKAGDEVDADVAGKASDRAGVDSARSAPEGSAAVPEVPGDGHACTDGTPGCASGVPRGQKMKPDYTERGPPS
jgi:hypothetical protein